MQFDTVYVDMDGVLCDFDRAFLTLHDRMDMYGTRRAWQYERELALSTFELWEPVVAAGADWWANIPTYPWTHELMEFASNIGDVTILTRPLDMPQLPDASDIGNSVRGKAVWLRKQFGNAFTDVVYTAKKHCVSQRGVLLIDDIEDYEEPFEARGGRMIVFPQCYNRFSTMMDDRLGSVRAQYANLLTE